MKLASLLITALGATALMAGGCGLGFRMVPEGLPLGVGVASADYYAGLKGKQGQALLQGIHQLVTSHRDLGYDRARDVMFATVDDLDGDDVVACVYIARRLERVRDRVTAYRGGKGLNAEHTWPQSLGAEGVAKSDLHHLFPSDCEANGRRSSHPFGVVSKVQWSAGGSKLGLAASGQVVFEPREAHQGNVARAIFYFFAAYATEHHVDTRNFKLEEETLKRWHAADPVDAAERARNEAIYKAQGNRNPFVDHPEYVAAVGRFHGGLKKVTPRRGR